MNGLRTFVEQLMSKCVSRYRKIGSVTKSRNYWKWKCIENGRFNQQISGRVALKRADDFMNHLQEVSTEGTDLKSALVCRYIKNNETCMQMAYKLLYPHFIRNNNIFQWSLDDDPDRVANFVIQGTQCGLSHSELQIIKNTVCLCSVCVYI